MSSTENNPIAKILLVTLVLAPAINHALVYLLPSYGLIWIGFYTLQLYPVAWTQLPIFQFGEMGLVVPNIPTTLVGCIFYLALVYSANKLQERWRKT
jgi:hypothetical protein